MLLDTKLHSTMPASPPSARKHDSAASTHRTQGTRLTREVRTCFVTILCFAQSPMQLLCQHTCLQRHIIITARRQQQQAHVVLSVLPGAMQPCMAQHTHVAAWRFGHHVQTNEHPLTCKACCCPCHAECCTACACLCIHHLSARILDASHEGLRPRSIKAHCRLGLDTRDAAQHSTE